MVVAEMRHRLNESDIANIDENFRLKVRLSWESSVYFFATQAPRSWFASFPPHMGPDVAPDKRNFHSSIVVQMTSGDFVLSTSM